MISIDRRLEGLAGFFLLLGAVGCGATAEDGGEALGEVDEPILAGTVVTVDTIGSPYLSTGCSSTLLSDRWILTAKHCVDEGLKPAALTATLLDGSSAVADAIYLNPSYDVAIVHLISSLTDSDGRSFANPLWLGQRPSLDPGPVYCQGWGRNTTDGSGSGVLRSAVMPVQVAFSTPYYYMPKNNLGQELLEGDSGAACFITRDGVPRITGIHLSHSDSTDRELSVDAFRDWAEGIVGNAVTLFSDPNFQGRSQQLLPSGPLEAGSYDRNRLTVGNDSVSSLALSTKWAVSLYRDPGFVNGLGTFTGAWTSVQSSVNDQTSAAKVFGGGVILYNDRDFGTRLATVASAGRVSFTGSLNNNVSSLTVPSGWQVTLFDGADFTGARATFQEGSYNFVGWSFNDLASSIQVEEPVTLYRDPNYTGDNARLVPGCYNKAQLGIPDDSLSSIYVPAGMSATLYHDNNQTPSSGSNGPITLTSNQATMPSGWNDTVTSLCIGRR